MVFKRVVDFSRIVMTIQIVVSKPGFFELFLASVAEWEGDVVRLVMAA